MAWEYKREEQQFKALPEGSYRIRVRSAEKAVSKSSGNDMLALQFDVSGSNTILYHYITFLDDRPEITNRMLTQFFDSFPGIPEGDFNMANWIGKVGACRVKQEDYDGNARAKISYFIKAGKQDDLPAWKEPENAKPSPSAGGPKVDAEGFMDVDDLDDIPFS